MHISLWDPATRDCGLTGPNITVSHQDKGWSWSLVTLMGGHILASDLGGGVSEEYGS